MKVKREIGWGPISACLLLLQHYGPNISRHLLVWILPFLFIPSVSSTPPARLSNCDCSKSNQRLTAILATIELSLEFGFRLSCVLPAWWITENWNCQRLGFVLFTSLTSFAVAILGCEETASLLRKADLYSQPTPLSLYWRFGVQRLTLRSALVLI